MSEKFLEENIKAEDAIVRNDLSSAAAILIEIINNAPQNWRAYNSMGIIAWLRRAWQDSYTMFMRSVTLNPGYSDALLNLFDAALKLKKVRLVIPYFQKAVKQGSISPEIKIIYESIIKFGEDIYYTPRALKIGTHNALCEEARNELNSGNLNMALDKFSRSLEKEGPNAEAFCGLGIIHYYQKRYKEAYNCFCESIKLNPVEHDTYLNLIDTAKASGMQSEAYEFFQSYRDKIPGLKSLSKNFESMVLKEN
ncbi:tetratricopeptide repeat protein [Chitinispirillales bacterium ANBcel5]|uniref:tetratricopeptide repeat protein n=1 Tax=Cellulosispirillum alkaliphilum TaxID=3039283 RepID=UPI002A54ADC3|nr:tetratricopeptide repeat protein [Chitinispirillales bacterium ANBcel5]